MDSSFAQSLGPKGGGADSSQTLHTISSYISFPTIKVPRYLFLFPSPQPSGSSELGVWIPPVLGVKPGAIKKSQKGENPFIVGEMA